MKPAEQKSYWDARIAAWDSSAYQRGGARPWIERLAGAFRADLRVRKAHAIEVVTRMAPQRLLELGCGTGELFASLPHLPSLREYVGVDISSVAVAQAIGRAAPAAQALRPEFVCSALHDLDPSRYSRYDFVLAMGLLPYLTDGELAVLARLLRGKRFLLDYHRGGPSVWNLLHACYRRVAGHPFYRMHRDEDVARRLREEGVDGFALARRGHLSFVQRLSIDG